MERMLVLVLELMLLMLLLVLLLVLMNHECTECIHTHRLQEQAQ